MRLVETVTSNCRFNIFLLFTPRSRQAVSSCRSFRFILFAFLVYLPFIDIKLLVTVVPTVAITTTAADTATATIATTKFYVTHR